MVPFLPAPPTVTPPPPCWGLDLVPFIWKFQESAHLSVRTMDSHSPLPRWESWGREEDLAPMPKPG